MTVPQQVMEWLNLVEAALQYGKHQVKLPKYKRVKVGDAHYRNAMFDLKCVIEDLKDLQKQLKSQ